jgi:hypothetical protein
LIRISHGGGDDGGEFERVSMAAVARHARGRESRQLRLAIGDAEAEVGLVICGFAWSARGGR